MNTVLIFVWVFAAMIATAFFEAYIEGKNAWAKKQAGWKIVITKNLSITAYHFWMFFVAYPLLILLPLAINGFDKILFGILTSAYFLGLIVEDFFWFIVNPFFGLKKFNPKNAAWYPWISILRLNIPLCYIIYTAIAFSSYWFLWR